MSTIYCLRRKVGCCQEMERAEGRDLRTRNEEATAVAGKLLAEQRSPILNSSNPEPSPPPKRQADPSLGGSSRGGSGEHINELLSNPNTTCFPHPAPTPSGVPIVCD